MFFFILGWTNHFISSRNQC